MNATESNDLAGHIRGVVFKRFSLNRRTLEEKWNRNHAAFRRDPGLDPKGTWKASEKRYAWQSDSFCDVSKQKVSTAYGIVRDMLLKGGKLQFMLAPDLLPGESPPEAQLPGTAENEAAAMEQLCHRQLEACDASTHLSSGILSGALYGEYWFKRHVDTLRTERFADLGDGVFELTVDFQDTLAVEHKSVWNLFTDLENENLQENEGIIERQPVSSYELRQLRDEPGYLPWAIDAILTDDLRSAESTQLSDESKSPSERALQERIRDKELLEFWGRAPRKMVEAFQRQMREEAQAFQARHPDAALPDLPAPGLEAELNLPEDEGDDVEITATECAGRIIRFAPAEAGDRPFYHDKWENLIDGLGGVSVADNVEDHQKVLNGAVRNLEDNAKLASNIMFACAKRMGQDQIGELFTGKVFDFDDDTLEDVRKVLYQVTVEAQIEPLIRLIEMYLQFADLSSMIPRAEQGQQGDHQQTAYELSQRLERAGKYLGAVIANYDRVITDVVTDFYRFNMLNPAVTVGKGAFRVKALGFSSFENRVVRLQKLIQLLELILAHPELLTMSKLRWLYQEIIKAMDVDPDQIVKTPEEMQLEAQAKAQELAQQQMMEQQAAQGGGAVPEEVAARVAKLQAEIERLDAESELKRTTAAAKAEEMTIRRAEALSRMDAESEQRAAAAPPPVPVAVEPGA